MKKKQTISIAVLAAMLMVMLFSSFSFGKINARADEEIYNLSAYDVVFDVQADCTMSVTETITINYIYTRTGFIRDIPVSGNAQVKHVSVSELLNGEECDVDYDVYMEYSEYISVDIGDTSGKQGEFTYVLRYDYYVPKLQNNVLSINPIGTQWDCNIYNASVTLNLPDGFLADSTKCYIGENYSAEESIFSVSGNTVTVSRSYLPSNNGITFDLYFEDGVLTSHVSAAPWIALLFGLAILAALIVLKFLKFTDEPLTPVVNFTAPNGMDPLAVGQLIDGTVSDSDVTSLIFYWADKGYLKINFEDEKNPELIRVYARLPENAPDYQKDMFNSLFASGDSVKVKSLSQKFYPVIERVKKKTTPNKRAMYDKTSNYVALALAIAGGLFAALVPMLLAMITISAKMFSPAYIITIVPAVIIFLLTRSVYYARLKRTKVKTGLLLAAIALLGALFIAIYWFLVPYTVFETVPKIIAGIIALAIAMLSVTLIVRTKLYTEQLNGILGFKNFILYTEKDKLEAMLKEDPQLYYHVLPYAQVLGVTDIWEDKFKALTVEPPKWLIDPARTYVDFIILNRCMRSTFIIMNTTMNSRPSSSGGAKSIGGGGFRGGFGGGVGGGFGGGGGRVR